MRHCRLAFLIVLSSFFPAYSDVATPPRDVSAELKTIVVQSGVPALVAGIVGKDGLIALGAAGVRRSGSPSMITKNDEVHLGSCTKAMTATVIAMLVEDGTLSWNDTLGGAFPELHESMNAKWQSATLPQLLMHVSGAPADLHFDRLWDRLWSSNDPQPEQRMELVRAVLARPPEADPGTKFIYANAGYAIAGAMAERVAGVQWEDLMRQRLFVPLGMTSAGFGAPGTPDRVNQPRGHRENGTSVEPGRDADNPPAIAPAGAVRCTIADWAKFIQLHLNAEMGNPRILSANSFRTLHTPSSALKPNYAMGWGVYDRDWAGGRVLTHNGTNTLWYCVVWIAPVKGFAVMAACNQGGKKAQKSADEAAWMLVQQHLRLKN
jgi:CubicO group peptidase (beta-lactamase class C family)